MRFKRLLMAASGLAAFLTALNSPTIAQEVCVEYHLVPRTVYEDKSVTRYRDVIETVYETKEETDYVPVYTTEKRERVHVSYKPVKKTTMREEEYTVYKPVTETRFREETYEETEYETVTEMRKEKVIVEKPVTETRFREETVLVRKPVRKTEMKSRIVTTFRPVQTVETDYVPGALLTNQVGSEFDRARLNWLNRGYYWDANEGRYIFRRRGLHWTRSPQTTQTPVLIAQPREATAYVPETKREETPVEILDYEELIEVRKVPVEVKGTQETIEYRDVPVQVEKPIKRTKTRRIPYEETRYEKTVKVRQVPVESMTYEKVERIEPYEKTSAKWVAKTREVKVPRQVTRSVPYQTTERVAKTVMMKVPVDQFGNILGPAVPVSETSVARAYDRSATTSPRQIESSGPSVLERTETAPKSTSNALRETSGRQVIQYGSPRVREPAKQTPVDSIIVPETIPTYQNAQTSLIEIRRRPKSLEETSGTTWADSTPRSGAPVRKQPIRILGEYEELGLENSEPGKSGDNEILDVPPAPAVDTPKIEAVDDLDKPLEKIADPDLGI